MDQGKNGRVHALLLLAHGSSLEEVCMTARDELLLEQNCITNHSAFDAKAWTFQGRHTGLRGN
jgi:hypothetical protein